MSRGRTHPFRKIDKQTNKQTNRAAWTNTMAKFAKYASIPVLLYLIFSLSSFPLLHSLLPNTDHKNHRCSFHLQHVISFQIKCIIFFSFFSSLASSFPSPPSFSSLFHPLLFLLDAQRAIRPFTLSFCDALPLRYVFSLNSQPSFVCAVPFPSSPTSAARVALSLSPPCAALIAAIRLGRGRGGGGGRKTG